MSMLRVTFQNVGAAGWLLLAVGCSVESPDASASGFGAADAAGSVGTTGLSGGSTPGAPSPAANGGGSGMRASAGAARANAGAAMSGTAAAGSGAAPMTAGAGAGDAPSASAAAGVGAGAVGAAGSGAVSAAAGSGAASAAAGSGAHSAAAGSGAIDASGNITIWLAGDSTVAKGETPCPVGWGAEFQPLFKPEAKVANSAVGGRSVRTWLYEVQMQMDSSGECALNKDSSGEPVQQARWQQMLDAMSGMHAGDYLFIQFGINDSSATCDRHVGLDAFKESYGMMAEAAKKHGAQPIFVTPVSAISCSGSSARPTRGSFVTATTEAGSQYDVPVVDLHARSIDLYNQQGLCPIAGGSDVSASTGGKAGAFFCDDHTHFSAQGAEQIAKLVAEALRDQNIGLAAYLK